MRAARAVGAAPARPHCVAAGTFARSTASRGATSGYVGVEPRRRRRTGFGARAHGLARLVAQQRRRTDSGGGNGDKKHFERRVEELLIRGGRFLTSSRGQSVFWLLLVWLVVTGRIGWIFDSFLIVFVLLSLLPVVGAFALRWWLAANVKEGACPNCNRPVTGVVKRRFACPSCGQQIVADKRGAFVFDGPASAATINVEAREVNDE